MADAAPPEKPPEPDFDPGENCEYAPTKRLRVETLKPAREFIGDLLGYTEESESFDLAVEMLEARDAAFAAGQRAAPQQGGELYHRSAVRLFAALAPQCVPFDDHHIIDQIDNATAGLKARNAALEAALRETGAHCDGHLCWCPEGLHNDWHEPPHTDACLKAQAILKAKAGEG